MEGAFLAKLPRYPEARATVDVLRARVVALLVSHGAIHFQVGGTHPCHNARETGHAELRDRLTAAFDRARRINQCALGYPLNTCQPFG